MRNGTYKNLDAAGLRKYHNEKSLLWKRANPEKNYQVFKNWKVKNLLKRREWARLWARNNYQRRKQTLLKNGRACKDRLYDLFFDHYGYQCTCCGESRRDFLTIEHLNGGGSAHRKRSPGGADRIIREIRDAGWPKEYTTLCMNCNFAKWRKGVCPHVVEKARVWLKEIQAIQMEMDNATPS